MSYGHLTVVCGPMYAGKTTELLKRVLWARNGEERAVLVVKPSFDDRYSETRIVTHHGLSTNAHSIKSWDEVEKRADFAEIVFLDEVQFFEAPYFEGDVLAITEKLLQAGKTVVANGLDMDAKGKPFPVTGLLMAMADEVVKIKATCSTCGKPATKTFKVVADDKRVELGSTGLYEPRCNDHWSVLTDEDAG